MLSTHKQTNRQTNQRYQKHNLLCQGGNKQTDRQTNQRYQKHNLLAKEVKTVTAIIAVA